MGQVLKVGNCFFKDVSVRIPGPQQGGIAHGREAGCSEVHEITPGYFQVLLGNVARKWRVLHRGGFRKVCQEAVRAWDDDYGRSKLIHCRP
jgi:hypothetical protein